MRNVSRFVGPLMGALFLFHAPAALAADAAPDPKKVEAAQRFDRGLELFDDGDNAGALAEFKRTYELFPNPVVLYNIGLVYAAMRRPVEAVDALEKVASGEGLSAEQRERAKATLTDQKARIGRLSVTTTPEGARIEVDNVEVGKTPVTAPIRVAEGSHMVGAVAEGFAPARKEVLIAGNADATVHLDLVSSEGKRLANLTVKSLIAGAEVRVDGEPAGKTPLATSLTLVAGHHKVELRRPGYNSVQKEIDVGEGATGELSFDLSVDRTQLGAEGANMALDISESGAVVFVDEESKGPYTTPLRLPKGPHHIRVERAGFLPVERDVSLESGKSNDVHIDLEPTAETRASYESSAHAHRLWGWVGIIGGAAIAGGSAAYLTLVTGPKNDLDQASRTLDEKLYNLNNKIGVCNVSGGGNADQCNAEVADAQSAYDDAKSKKDTHDIISYVGIGIGGAAIVTGVILLVTGDDPDRYSHEKHQLGKGDQGPKFAVLPGPGQAGLSLGAVF